MRLGSLVMGLRSLARGKPRPIGGQRRLVMGLRSLVRGLRSLVRGKRRLVMGLRSLVTRAGPAMTRCPQRATFETLPPL